MFADGAFFVWRFDMQVDVQIGDIVFAVTVHEDDKDNPEIVVAALRILADNISRHYRVEDPSLAYLAPS